MRSSHPGVNRYLSSAVTSNTRYAHNTVTSGDNHGLRPLYLLSGGHKGPRGPILDPQEGGSATPPPGPPPGAPPGPGAQGGKLSRPGDGGHLTDFEAN